MAGEPIPLETVTPVRHRVANWKLQLAQRESQILLVVAIIIGALAGLAVVGFILVTERLGARLYPPGVSAMRRVFGPILGALTMGYLLSGVFRDSRGNGVIQTKNAFYSSDGRITLHSIVGKFFCTSVTLASGIPLGPEGPSVAVGAGIASIIGRKLNLSPEKVKALLPIGATAAIAAAFNTPIAAVLFSLEEIIGDLNAPVLGSVVLASATAWMVLRLLLGNNPIFHVPQYELVHPLEFFVYAILGVAGGIVSGLFVGLTMWLRAKFKLLPEKTLWAQPLAGGIVVGLAGWLVPEVLGVGYVHISALLAGNMAIRLAATLVLLKVITVAVSSASGNAGGIFAPTLFIGAMLGGTVGGIAHHLLPSQTGTPGAYALVGMGALFAGVVRTPMTSVMLVFEVTRDYAIIVPLMIANLVSYFVSRKIHPDTLYESMADQDGIHLPTARDHERVTRKIAQVMRQPDETLAADLRVAAAGELVRGSQLNAWPVVDQKAVVGVISAKTLLQLIEKGQSDASLGEIVKPGPFPHVHMDHPIEMALARMGEEGLEIIPVVSRFNVNEMLGIVHLTDVLKAYGISTRGPTA